MMAHQQSEVRQMQAPDKPRGKKEVKDQLSIVADVMQVLTFLWGTISALIVVILFLKDKVELSVLIFLVVMGVFIFLGGLAALYSYKTFARIGRELIDGQGRNEVQLAQFKESVGEMTAGQGRSEDQLAQLEDELGQLKESFARMEKTLNPSQGYEDKYERMKKKYSYVPFNNSMQSTNEFPASETHAVKIGLMKGVVKSVYAIYRVETYLPLPMYPTDDQNYFQENIHARRRIRKDYSDDFEAPEFNIHRIFVIASEFLQDPDRVRVLQGIIGRQQDEKFDVRIALKEDLVELPAFEFAIYDNEIALRLGINQAQKCYAEGIVYFDDAVWRDVYIRRYKAIESQSCSPALFWKRFENEIKGSQYKFSF